MAIPVNDNVYVDHASTWPDFPHHAGTWIDHAPSAFASTGIEAESWVWSDLTPLTSFVTWDEYAHQDIAPATQWSLPVNTPTQSIFIVTLRADGLDNLEVPAKNIQIRRRDGQPTYVLAVVPDAKTYRDLATPYKGGDIRVDGGVLDNDGTRHLSELIKVDFDSLVEDTGVRGSSLSLSGYRTWTSNNPREVELSNIYVYSLQSNGKRRIRCPVNIFLRPGDTATFSPGQGLVNESMVVGQITVLIDARNQRMDVTEA